MSGLSWLTLASSYSSKSPNLPTLFSLDHVTKVGKAIQTMVDRFVQVDQNLSHLAEIGSLFHQMLQSVATMARRMKDDRIEHVNRHLSFSRRLLWDPISLVQEVNFYILPNKAFFGTLQSVVPREDVWY